MKKPTITEVSEILRKCPNSYLWLKSRDVWDEVDYKNLEKIKNSEKVISRVEPRKYVQIVRIPPITSKKVKVTKDGISETFNSMKEFTEKCLNITPATLTKQLKKKDIVEGYKIEVL